MEAAPRLIDISEKRAERRDAAPLTSNLLARKGEAVSAARDVLNAQAATTLPPAARQEDPPSRFGFALSKQWLAVAAIVLICGSVAIGYLSRPTLDKPAAAVKIPTPQPLVADATRRISVDGNKDTELSVKSGGGKSDLRIKPDTAIGKPEQQTVQAAGALSVTAAPKPVAAATTVPVAAAIPVQTLPSIPAPPIVEPPVVKTTFEAQFAKSKVPPHPEVPAPPPVVAPPAEPAPLKMTMLTSPRPKPAPVKPPLPAKTVVAVRTPAKVDTPPVVGPDRPYMLQLVSVKSETAANREWERLQKRFAGLFGSLDPSVQKVVLKKRGTFYRLRANGFGTRRQASGVCQELKAAGQGCLVVKR